MSIAARKLLSGGLGFGLTFLSAQGSGSDLSSYSFTGISAGQEDTNRIIIVCAVGRLSSGTGSITGITIGGNAATQIVATSSNQNIGAIYALSVPTGATVDVVVTPSAAAVRMAISVYALYGKSAVTAHASSSQLNLAGSSAITADTEVNGVAVCLILDLGTTSRTSTLSNLTDRSIFSVDSPTRWAYASDGSANDGGNASARISTWDANNVSVMATWAP